VLLILTVAETRGCNTVSPGNLQDEIHTGVLIVEFTDSEVLDPYCRSTQKTGINGRVAAIAPKDGAPAGGFMQ
jgi:hypothetical protein